MAYEWNKTAFVEFETMLRRRLRSGAAPVAACAGFDLDAASAYLEGALGGSHRAGYESHLAGCATCRRHLIELARLAACAPQAEAQPATVADQTPAWVRLREVVAGRFDLSAWNLKWQIAGAAGAAFAILIAALSVQSWRQASDGVIHAISSERAAPSPAAEPGVQPLQLSGAEPSLLNEQLPVGGALIASRQEQLRTSVPEPSIRPIDSLPAVVGRIPGQAFASNRSIDGLPAVSNNSLNLSLSQTIEALPPNPRADTQAEAQESRDIALERKLSPQGAPTPPANNSHNINGPYLADLRAQSQAVDLAAQSQGNELAARITPRLGINPANTGPKQTPTSDKAKTEKRSTPLILPKGVRKALSLLVPLSDSNPKPESDRKAKVNDSNDESSKPMLIPIRDKVFRFEKDILIDREYKPEMQEWRVWTLKIGSEAYKQVLANEPQLKEFFDRGPILIVWKNRIYKVLK